MIEVKTHRSMSEIEVGAWNALLSDASAPHLRWEFLDAFEKTNCVGSDAGWVPMPITFHRDGQMIAAAPAYVKGNSDGEFVFDHGWARFCHEQLETPYYPKLIIAVPFTPATGPRILFKPGGDEREALYALANAVKRLVDLFEFSGGHVLLPTAAQAATLREAGMRHRYGLQYHWRNAGYGHFDDFLGRFSSKRRHQIKRELRALDEQGLKIESVAGSDWTPEMVDLAFDFYRSTVDKHFWGRRYLNRSFFEHICSVMPEQLLMVVARERGSRRAIAGAFNLLGSRTMYGRYWGATEERPFLHFNVCYYQGIRECIERGLEVFEPGAGGEHKLARGFETTITHSLHYIRHPAFAQVLDDFLRRERAAVEERLGEGKAVLKPV